MEVNSLLIALIFPAIAVAQVTNTVYLDNSAGNECGQSTKLSSGSQIRLSTNGKTEDGYCGFLIHRISDPNTKCPFPGMCARIDNSKMTSCQSKVAFTGKYFDKTPDSTQELSCYIKPKGAQFCTQAPAMRVEVTEKPDYAMKEAHDYGFNITVYSQCFDNKEAVIVEYVEDDYRAPNLEEGWHMNYILGIVTASCICSIFLIILCTVRLYTRNNPNYRNLSSDAKK